MQLIRRINQRGDTIVEVLIAIAVVSSILASSFVVIHRTSQNIRQSEEHGVALKLIEGQVEQLKAAAANGANTNAIFNRTGSNLAFCIQGGAVRDINAASLPAPAANYNSGCNTTDGVRYNYGITKDASSTFKANVVWDGPTGRQEQVEILYRVYEP